MCKDKQTWKIYVNYLPIYKLGGRGNEKEGKKDKKQLESNKVKSLADKKKCLAHNRAIILFSLQHY
jgi:hypothetical protein